MVKHSVKTPMADSKKIVLPGQRLTVEEEYEPGTNTYTDDEGNVISTTAGHVTFNEDAREVHVQNEHHNAKGVEVGSIVVGRITLVKDAVALMTIGYAEKNGQKRQIFDATGAIGVSRASRDFVRSMHDLFQIGDFVRAKVSSVTRYSTELMTADKGLGKILSRDDVIQSMRDGKETLPEATNTEQE